MSWMNELSSSCSRPTLRPWQQHDAVLVVRRHARCRHGVERRVDDRRRALGVPRLLRVLGQVRLGGRVVALGVGRGVDELPDQRQRVDVLDRLGRGGLAGVARRRVDRDRRGLGGYRGAARRPRARPGAPRAASPDLLAFAGDRLRGLPRDLLLGQLDLLRRLGRARLRLDHGRQVGRLQRQRAGRQLVAEPARQGEPELRAVAAARPTPPASRRAAGRPPARSTGPGRCRRSAGRGTGRPARTG